MKKYNRIKGQLGENMARKYLEEKSYKFIEANFFMRGGELDLIMTDNDFLVFVEVKLKIGDDFGSPEEMISRSKIAFVKKTAQMFLIKNPKISNIYKRHRIDVVCIKLNQDKSIDRINHYQNVDL